MKQGISMSSIIKAMNERMHQILALACSKGHDAVVLGAWGCGVFQNDPSVVAAQWAQLLRGPFKNRFRKVCFAVCGPLLNREPFVDQFGNVNGSCL